MEGLCRVNAVRAQYNEGCGMKKCFVYGAMALAVSELFLGLPMARAEPTLLHWNVDNDDGSDNSLGSPKRPGGDYLQTGQATVSGENDLSPLCMSLEPNLSVGNMVLTVIGTNATIWGNAEKGSADWVLTGPGTKTWHLNDANEKAEFVSLCAGMWVEGTGGGECEIWLAFVDPYGHEVCFVSTNYMFVAADCGRQPKTSSPNERITAETAFPSLVHCEWSITAEAASNYNCIAWSVGQNNLWIGAVGPPEYGDEFMDRDYGNNDGILQMTDVDAFYAAKGLGTVTTDITEATAIYYSKFHGARRMGCSCGAGKWLMFESKCGQWVRMEHPWEQLNGDAYGTPVRYYKP